MGLHLRRRSLQRMVIGAGVGLILAYAVLPVMWLFITALKHPIEITQSVPTFIPQNPTLQNFVAVLRGYDADSGLTFPVLIGFRNSLVTAVTATAIGTAVATLGAYALVRVSSTVANALFMAVLIMRTIPRISVAIPLYLLITRLGLLDSIWGLVITHLTVVVPIATFLMRSYLTEMGTEIEESAWVDGATRWQAFVRIVLPIARPGIAVTAIFSFILSYNEFLYSLIVSSTTKSLTLPVALSTFIMEYGVMWHLLSAAGTLAIIPVAVVGLLVQKAVVRGLTLGATKG